MAGFQDLMLAGMHLFIEAFALLLDEPGRSEEQQVSWRPVCYPSWDQQTTS